MGNSEPYKEEKKDINFPNTLKKDIVSGSESINSEKENINKNKNNRKALIKENDSSSQEQENKFKNYKIQNHISLNINNEFDDLNNGNRYNDNDNEIITRINKKQQQYQKNLFVAHTAEAIKMEITNQKNNLYYRKFKFNGITVVQNLKDYLPSNITKRELKDMVYNAFGEGLVDDKKYYIPGKTITREQTDAIIDLILQYIKDDANVENLENDSILDGVNLTIDLVDLNKEIIKNKMFKGKNPSDIQLENTLKNLSQGLNNVKILSIEFQ